MDKVCGDKVCVDKVCGDKVYVDKVWRRAEEEAEEKAEPGIQNQKQEPHTKMWGKRTELLGGGGKGSSGADSRTAPPKAAPKRRPGRDKGGSSNQSQNEAKQI